MREAWKWSKMQNLLRAGENFGPIFRKLSIKGGKISGPILAVSGSKFMKAWQNVGNSLQFPTPFLGYLPRVTFRRHWQVERFRGDMLQYAADQLKNYRTNESVLNEIAADREFVASVRKKKTAILRPPTSSFAPASNNRFCGYIFSFRP